MVCRVVGGALQTCDESLELDFFDPTRLPGDMLATHRIRIEDAIANRPEGIIR
jgi:hypothetical protein